MQSIFEIFFEVSFIPLTNQYSSPPQQPIHEAQKYEISYLANLKEISSRQIAPCNSINQENEETASRKLAIKDSFGTA